jgi:hypothetical protein
MKMRIAAPLSGLLLLMGCAVDQSAAIPPDPDAPFPLANTTIVGQPQPGVLLIRERDIIVNRVEVQRAARVWCDGPAQVSSISTDRSALGQIDALWLVRCD